MNKNETTTQIKNAIININNQNTGFNISPTFKIYLTKSTFKYLIIGRGDRN